MKRSIYPRQTALPLRQQGVSLLEVMIAMLVLSFGLLGLASLQMATLRNNQSSFDNSRAIMSVYSITDIMRADMSSQGALNMANAFPAGRKADWLSDLKSNLGDDATGSIQCTPTTTTPILGDPFISNICTVTISWTDVQGGTTRTMTTEVQL